MFLGGIPIYGSINFVIISFGKQRGSGLQTKTRLNVEKEVI